MKPLSLTNKQFEDLMFKEIVISFSDIRLTGQITHLNFSHTHPKQVGSFNFELSPESQSRIGKLNIETVSSFRVDELDNIDLSN